MSKAAWRKSSYSGSGGGNCVEVAAAPRTVAVRDTTDREGPALTFTTGSWGKFVRRVKDGAGRA